MLLRGKSMRTERTKATGKKRTRAIIALMARRMWCAKGKEQALGLGGSGLRSGRQLAGCDIWAGDWLGTWLHMAAPGKNPAE